MCKIICKKDFNIFFIVTINKIIMLHYKMRILNKFSCNDYCSICHVLLFKNISILNILDIINIKNVSKKDINPSYDLKNEDVSF